MGRACDAIVASKRKPRWAEFRDFSAARDLKFPHATIIRVPLLAGCVD